MSWTVRSESPMTSRSVVLAGCSATGCEASGAAPGQEVGWSRDQPIGAEVDGARAGPDGHADKGGIVRRRYREHLAARLVRACARSSPGGSHPRSRDCAVDGWFL